MVYLGSFTTYKKSSEKIKNLSNLDFDLLKVKCVGDDLLPMYEFLLVVNIYSNTWPNLTDLRDISLQNLNDLDIDLQGHSSQMQSHQWTPHTRFSINV